MTGDFPKRLEVLASYVGLTTHGLKSGLREYIVKTYNENADHVRTKVGRIFESAGYPQDKTVNQVAGYFESYCGKLQKEFKPVWLQKAFVDFERIEPLQSSLDKVCEPGRSYSVFKQYGCYTALAQHTLRHQFKDICRDFLITRVHSRKEELVQDVLRIHAYENGTGRCTLYQYTTQQEDENENVKRSTGNLFSHDNAFYLIVSAGSRYESCPPEFCFFTFPRDFMNKDNLGTVNGLTDKPIRPLAAIVKISSRCPKRFDNPEEHVEVLKDGLETQEIRRELLFPFADRHPFVIAEEREI
ncbi:MAG: hypothetical protein V3V31_16200 [Methylococcales bacterium]